MIIHSQLHKNCNCLYRNEKNKNIWNGNNIHETQKLSKKKLDLFYINALE